MIIKVFYKKETHVMVLDKADFESLFKKIKTSFSNLPQNISLSYVDCEGDRISVADTNDLAVIFEIPNQKSIKLEIEDYGEIQCESNCKTEETELFENVDVCQTVKEPQAINVSSTQEKSEIKPTNSLTLKFDPQEEHDVHLELEDQVETLLRSKIEQIIPEIKQAIQKLKPSKIKSIHYGVTCDGCGVKPIVGIRYKSSVQYDFDYCQKCEETIDHPYAFLKIKTPAQAPRVLIASMVDDFIPGLDVNGLTFDQQNLQSLFKKTVPIVQPVIQTIVQPVPETQTSISEIATQSQPQKTKCIIPQPQLEHVIPMSQDSEQQKLIQVASFLQSIYEIDFFEAYNFSKSHSEKPLQEICQIYLNKINQKVQKVPKNKSVWKVKK